MSECPENDINIYISIFVSIILSGSGLNGVAQGLLKPYLVCSEARTETPWLRGRRLSRGR